MAFNFLIVDDSVIIRSMLVKTLQASGVPTNEVFQAGNGQEALDTLAANWVDMVFADINMPIMDGVEMIENMQKEEVFRGLPVVVVSTEGSETKIERLWNKGIRAFIRKPFTPEIIRDIVQDVLGEWDETGNDTATDF